MEKKKPKVSEKRKHYLELGTTDDVRRCLAQNVRELREIKCVDLDLDPIRIDRGKALTGALRALAAMMANDGITLVSDDAIRAEVRRRDQLERNNFATQQASASTQAH